MQNAASVALIAAYVAWFVWPWTGAGFSPDDLMNCHRALTQTWWKLLADHATVFQPTPEYRPLGSFFYRTLYTAFGFNPVPFHAALYALLAINSLLTFAAVRRLTGNAAAAWIATVLHAWHGNWAGLHMNTGFCFDVLCYTFFTAALVAFLSDRRWLFLAFFLLSLNAKEMAVSLPLICLVWDRARDPKRTSAALAALLLTVLFIVGRVLAPEGLTAISAYRPRYDAATLLARSHGYLAAAAYHIPSATLALEVLLAAATGWTAWRHPRVGAPSAAILFVGILPVAFIEQRGFEAMYVPALGAAILLAMPVAAVLSRARWLTGPVPATLTAILLAGSFHYIHRQLNSTAGERTEADHIMEVSRQLRARVPCLDPHSRLLFLADPFPQYEWNSLFLVRLVYGDMSLEVDRPGRARPGIPYAAKLAWNNHRFHSWPLP